MTRRLLLTCAVAFLALGTVASADYTLTILHNNDGESQLLGADDPNYGGIARFKAVVDRERADATTAGNGVLMISSGDNFLAGKEFSASLNSGPMGGRTYYDAMGLAAIDYDAVIIGNHDFDFGPSVLANFIPQVGNAPYLSANLDVSADPALAPLIGSGDGLIGGSTIVTVSVTDTVVGATTKTVGIIGATTENLPFISSPGPNVVVGNVAAAVNTEIASLQLAGVDHIILASHLQGIAEDEALIPLLSPGIDLIIAGGGDNLLGNAPVDLIPGDSLEGPYPTVSAATDLGGNQIPIITSDGNYKYLGRIDMTFGTADSNTGNPVYVVDASIDPTNGVTPDAAVQTTVVAPVAAYVAGLESNIIGTTSVAQQQSSDLIRSRETNLGNLVADAQLAAAQTRAASFGVDSPQIAMPNGGGIRAPITAGDISEADSFDVSPFGNVVAVVEDVTTAELLLLLENCVSRVVYDPISQHPERQGGGTGRFAQVAGMYFTYDVFAQPLVLDPNENPDGSYNIATPGQRIIDVHLDDGTALILDGVAQPGITVDIALPDFSAGGGDQYFFYLADMDKVFTRLGVTDQQALMEYIEGLGGDLAGWRRSTTPRA